MAASLPADLAVSEFKAEGKRMFTGLVRDISDRRSAGSRNWPTPDVSRIWAWPRRPSRTRSTNH